MNHSLNGSGGLIETHFIKATREEKKKKKPAFENTNFESIGANPV
jgi:hypothetical protein